MNKKSADKIQLSILKQLLAGGNSTLDIAGATSCDPEVVSFTLLKVFLRLEISIGRLARLYQQYEPLSKEDQKFLRAQLKRELSLEAHAILVLGLAGVTHHKQQAKLLGLGESVVRTLRANVLAAASKHFRFKRYLQVVVCLLPRSID
jgi:hypothetical protein